MEDKQTFSSDSDILVKLSIKDNDGNLLFLSSGYIAFEFKDGTGRYFRGQSGNNPEYCYIEDGKLAITIPSNTFRSGAVMYRVMIAIPNDHFNDKFQNTWSEFEDTNIVITNPKSYSYGIK